MARGNRRGRGGTRARRVRWGGTSGPCPQRWAQRLAALGIVPGAALGAGRSWAGDVLSVPAGW
eukprot:scaffold5084_cov81-Isochrysis_galbana.AAC.2